MELTEKQVRELAEDRIMKCYGDGYCDLEAMINLFVDGYSEATRQINLNIPIVIKSVCEHKKMFNSNIVKTHTYCPDCNNYFIANDL